jgi:DNA-binding CsgD family transcriptional regulator
VRAGLLDQLASEDGVLDRWEEADETCRDALRLWRQLGDPLREGDTLRRLSRTAWRLGDGAECEALTVEAVRVLEPLGRTPELARAVAQLSGQRMNHGRFREAVELATHAASLAADLSMPDVEVDALNNLGCSHHGLGEEWREFSQRAVDVALAHGLAEQAGRAYTNLFSSLKMSTQYAEAERVFAVASAYCEDFDVPVYGNCLLGERAECLERTGRWAEAEHAATALLHKVDISPINKVHSWIVLAQLQVRRGSPEADETLRAGLALVDGMGEAQYSVPIRLALVERHWIDGDTEAAASVLADLADLSRLSDPWMRGAVAVWQRRLGLLPTTDDVAPPYSLQVAGDHAGAARAWLAVGARYEAALALLDGDDVDGWREGLDLLDGLGATAPAAAARRRLRAAGAKVPAGRRAATRAHPGGLTGREDDVARLVSEGLTNDEIAARLVISAKTVDHHVSSVLGKLGVATRREVGAALARLQVGELQAAT